jgi:sulfite reductase (NADPH) hemoprotein beta-component
VGNIGILGVDKHGEEFYQVTLGGEVGVSADTRVGDVIGRAFAAGEVPVVVGIILDLYVALRDPEERFIDTYRRIGIEPFRSAVYPTRTEPKEATHA